VGKRSAAASRKHLNGMQGGGVPQNRGMAIVGLAQL